MKVAVITDIHDHLNNLQKAIEYIKSHDVEQVICCGDFCAPFTAKILADANVPTLAVFGNNDGDQGGLILATQPKIQFSGVSTEHQETVIDNRKIAFTHYPKHAKLLFDLGHFDAVFHGHNHLKNLEENNGKILCNPGPLCGIVKGIEEIGTFAIYDTTTNQLEFIEV